MTKKSENIIIAASGTGGHIYPGISVAQEFRKNGYNPVFFVSDNDASMEIIKNSGFGYVSFNLSGMPRKMSFKFIVFWIKMFFAVIKAFVNIIKIKPFAVLGTGGYISVPAVIAGNLLFKKTYIHEQNSVPGVANKFLNGIACKTFISFEGSGKFFKNKDDLIVSGYPVREGILNVAREKAAEKLKISPDIFTVLVFGGSLGAAKLNEISFNAANILAEKEKIQILHIAGQKGYKELERKALGKENYKVFEYVHDMGSVYAASDVAVSRAGAGAVFELKALNKSAVLVPYPYAADYHQFYNAKEIERPGKYTVIEEKTLTAENLAAGIAELKNGPQNNETNTSGKLPQETIAQEIIKNYTGK